MYFTGKDKNETFVGQVMKPIYQIDDNEANNVIKTVYLFLWFITQYRLGRLNINEFLKN